jgi:hypothetical protein
LVCIEGEPDADFRLSDLSWTVVSVRLAGIDLPPVSKRNSPSFNVGADNDIDGGIAG